MLPLQSTTHTVATDMGDAVSGAAIVSTQRSAFDLVSQSALTVTRDLLSFDTVAPPVAPTADAAAVPTTVAAVNVAMRVRFDAATGDDASSFITRERFISFKRLLKMEKMSILLCFWPKVG
jgi:hypothetical protein